MTTTDSTPSETLDYLNPESLPLAPSQRLLSLDALRGFDMFWIIGGEGIVQAGIDLAGGKFNDDAPPPPINWHHFTYQDIPNLLAIQFTHCRWQGFHFYDLIFPMFVFIIGVSLVFSLSKLIETRGRAAAVKRVILRGVVLYLLGVLYYGGISHQTPDHAPRLMGVLQRLALAYFFAGLLFCYLRPRYLAAVAAGLLLVYWGIMSLVPAPGHGSFGHVSFEEGQNIANWIDARFLPGYKWDGDHDPEGLLSTLPAIASCLLGVFAGLPLRGAKFRPAYKVLILLGAGAASVALGFTWGMQFPIVKKLWSSSFVLVAGGYSAILLGLFYLIVDVWGLKIWTRPFVWIGMNPITLYIVWELIPFEKIARRFIGDHWNGRLHIGTHHIALQTWYPLAVNALAVALLLLLARFLYTRKVFVRV